MYNPTRQAVCVSVCEREGPQEFGFSSNSRRAELYVRTKVYWQPGTFSSVSSSELNTISQDEELDLLGLLV